jgi:hypothetical protein
VLHELLASPRARSRPRAARAQNSLTVAMLV